MTQEEAFKRLEQMYDFYAHAMDANKNYPLKGDAEAIKVALLVMAQGRSAHITREQVEKVWRSEWNDINPTVLNPGVSWVCRCAKCGCPQDYKHNFCPNCGDAKTDDAVDMVMERLEVLHEIPPTT